MSTIFAVDPGAGGGIAIWNRESNQIFAISMPDTDDQVVDLFKSNTTLRSEVVCEEMVRYAGVKLPASAIIKYGDNCGFIRGIAMSLGIRFETVKPKDWQKAVGVKKSRDESKDKFKRRLRDKAQQLYPDQNPTMKTCDALLILEYLKKRHEA